MDVSVEMMTQDQLQETARDMEKGKKRKEGEDVITVLVLVGPRCDVILCCPFLCSPQLATTHSHFAGSVFPVVLEGHCIRSISDV